MKDLIDDLRLLCEAKNLRFYFRSFDKVYEYDTTSNDYKLSALRFESSVVIFEISAVLNNQGASLKNIATCMLEYHTLASNAGIADIDSMQAAMYETKDLLKSLTENKTITLQKNTYPLADKNISFAPFARSASSNETSGVVATFRISLNLKNCC